MNKKIVFSILIFVVILAIFGAFALKNNNTLDVSENIEEVKNENEQKIMNEEKNTKETEINDKRLVLYFSATGNTKEVAERISKVSNSDIIEIIPKEEYTKEDLSYNNDNCRANKEQNDEKSRPEISNKINLEEYETIFLGYPIWWGTNPKIILSLLDDYNFDEKTVIPFCRSGSTGISKSLKDLKEYNSKINWLEGKRFNASVSEEEIKDWIDELEISSSKKEESMEMYIKVNNKVLVAEMEENSSVEGLIEKLKEKDITIEMEDYSNFEKVGNLDFNLPKNDKNISTNYGDLILYQGDKFVIYYDTNSWNFTKLGHIKDITQKELKNILGDGDVKVTLSLNK